MLPKDCVVCPLSVSYTHLSANRNKLTELASGSKDDKANNWFVGHPIDCISVSYTHLDVYKRQVEYKGKWYLFHHDCVPSGGTTWLRSLKVCELEYDAEGKIKTIESV